MINDVLARFSTAQSLATTVATLTSEGSYDQGVAKDAGPGEPNRLWLSMTTALVGASATMEAQLVTSASGTALSSPKVLWSSGVQLVGFWTLGLTFVIPVPTSPVGGGLRYLGMLYIIAGATTSAGAVTATLVKDGPEQRFYTNGFTVS